MKFPASIESAFRPAAALFLALGMITGCDHRAERKPVTHEYHGVVVTNDYEWLEKPENPAVRSWSKAQNRKARSHFDDLPVRDLLRDQLQRMYAKASPNYSALAWRAGKLFLLKFQPPAQQPVLITLNGQIDLKSEQVVLDPNRLSRDGSTTIDWFVPSADGKLVAISLSEKGSEDGTLYIYETATGRKLTDVLPRVQYPTGGGSAAWNADGSGLYYTRYPAKGERDETDLHFFQQVYFHKLGTPVEQDKLELWKGLPRIAEIELESSQDGRHLLARVANGDGGEFAHYLRTPKGEWKQVSRFEDGIKAVEFGRDPLYLEFGRDDSLYLLSTKDAPNGAILRVPLNKPELAGAFTVMREGIFAIQHFKPTASGLAIVIQRGGPEQLIYRDFFNPALSGPSSRSDRPDFRIPHSVGQLLVTHGDEILFRTETYTGPFTWWRYDTNKDRDKGEATALRGTSPVSFTNVETVRVLARSQDGTPVPMTILRRKGTRLNGENPTLLTGYGGYGISRTPRFDFTRHLWLDQGGVIAIANLRGGGEFGERWHEEGQLVNKQNVFDDFAACAEWLVRSNYTKPLKLAIEGGSNGGLLMGAMLTQHPDYMQAVVSHVGLYDMLRAELDPNGAFNVTEFGSVKDQAQFKALHAYSPYHHVQDQTNYPAVLMLTGEHDGRVNPAHSRKMIARLQAATASKNPILLRTSASSGHGAGTGLQERLGQIADIQAFLMEQLGMDYCLVERGPWSGGVTDTSAIIKAKLPRDGLSARLLVSKNPLLTSAKKLSAIISETNRYNLVAFSVRNLEPDTQYYYALEVDGFVARGKRGEFRTFPKPGPASFKIAFASCGRTASTRDVFDRIREQHPLFYMNMGDFHYLDINSDRPALFRAAYDTVLASPQQADLYRAVPFVYMWDDHDYGGNNATRKAKSHQAARKTYDEYVPHYPFADPLLAAPISQSFTVGRVKFILTDLRSDRDDPNDKDDARKSMLGDRQKEWFKQELLAANGKYPLICWMSSVPWIGNKGTAPYAGVLANQFGWIHHTKVSTNAATTNLAVNLPENSPDDPEATAGATNRVLVWQSSLFPNNTSGNAVDGNTRSFSHTADTANSYWMADLGQATRLDRIEIVNRIDCCADRLAGLVVRFFDAASNSLSSVVIPDTAAGGIFEHQLEPGTQVRWIRVGLENGQRNGGGNFYVTLAEVRAFAGETDLLASAIGLTLPGEKNNPQYGPTLKDSDRDDWSAFTTERREIADFIKSNHISGVCILHGDSHMLAADDGRNSDYATGGGARLPVMCAGPLDQNPSLKGGPYSQGVYRVRDKEGESGFGLLTVTDEGDSIKVSFSGRNNKNEEKISLKFSVPATPPARAK